MKENRNAWLGSPTGEHDLRSRCWYGFCVDFFGLKVQAALIDVTFRSFRATDRDFLSGSEALGRIGGPNDARDAELSRDNRCVRGAPALVGYDGGDTAHHWFPVRVRALSNQDFAIAYRT
jgi:hypothetical protein